MKGNRSKISSLTGAHDYNNDFDRLINDAAHERLRTKERSSMDRPAYYGTSLCPDGSSQYDGRILHAKSTEGSDGR